MRPLRAFAVPLALLIALPAPRAVAMELAEAAADAFFRSPYEPDWNKTVRPGSLVLTNHKNRGGAVWFIDQDRNEACVFHALHLSYRAGEDGFRWDASVVIDARAAGARLDVKAAEVALEARKPRLLCWRYQALSERMAGGAPATRDTCDDVHAVSVPLAHRTRFESAVAALREACGWTEGFDVRGGAR
jgi:hypothetical protein